jgi:hypothetical protein
MKGLERKTCTASPALAMGRALITTTGPAGAEDSFAASLVPRKVETSSGQLGV